MDLNEYLNRIQSPDASVRYTASESAATQKSYNEELREETRMAIERIPGNPSIHAHKSGLKSIPEAFHKNIEQSLHNRALRPATVGVGNAH